jgi:4'-phosphopantetheinyl transferase
MDERIPDAYMNGNYIRTISLDLCTDNLVMIDNCLSFASGDIYSDLKKDPSSFLHSDEISYFNAIRTEKRKKSFIMGRYACKIALSNLLKDPFMNDLDIVNGVFGQPFLRYHSNYVPEISITHASEYAFSIALEPGYNVAVDVEILLDSDIDRFESSLSCREKVLMKGISPAPDAASSVFWSSKEAVSKLIGTGFTAEMDIFELSGIVEIDDEIYCSRYKNFRKILCWSFIAGKMVLSVAMPDILHFDHLHLRDFIYGTPEIINDDIISNGTLALHG